MGEEEKEEMKIEVQYNQFNIFHSTRFRVLKYLMTTFSLIEIIGKAVVIDMNYKLTLVLFLAVVILIGAPVVSAKSGYLSSFNQNYNTSGTKLDTCNTCHTSSSGGSLNPYGRAYSGSGHNFASIETLDSDSDGFTNIEEINALTFPGNANDHPQTTSVTTTTNVTSATPTPATNVTQQQQTTTTSDEDDDDIEEEQEATEISDDDIKEQLTTAVPVNNTTQEKPTTEVPTSNTTETPKSPGFEAVLAVVGFLILVGLKRK